MFLLLYLHPSKLVTPPIITAKPVLNILIYRTVSTMSSQNASAEIASSVSRLSLKTGPKAKTKKAPVVDSWEDEDVSSGSEHDNCSHHSSSDHDEPSARNQAGTSAPPPTPMSPTYGGSRPFPPAGLAPQTTDRAPYDAAGPSLSGETRPRPEKTDAVARRMIAGALGLKAPRLSEEQKAYDRAVREKERRRKEEEREIQKKREQEALKAKQAVWED